jgi:hypothetical protein
MRRFQLIEIHDQPWCPKAWREALTDTLQFLDDHGGYYDAIAPKLAAALRKTGSSEITDLCSGGGGPWRRLRASLAQHGAEVSVRLTDLYPNLAAGTRIERESSGGVTLHPGSVNALSVPSELCGFRTLFTSFHHFPPQQAQKIIADAVKNREGIGIFELTKRVRLPLFLVMLPIYAVISIVGILIATPFVPPFRWSRLFWTYIIPVLPLMTVFDGAVSVMRSYTPSEMLEMAHRAGPDYEWSASEVPIRGPMMPVTYLIGTPRQ